MELNRLDQTPFHGADADGLKATEHLDATGIAIMRRMTAEMVSTAFFLHALAEQHPEWQVSLGPASAIIFEWEQSIETAVARTAADADAVGANTRWSRAAASDVISDVAAQLAVDLMWHNRAITSNYTAQCSHTDHFKDGASGLEWILPLPFGEETIQFDCLRDGANGDKLPPCLSGLIADAHRLQVICSGMDQRGDAGFGMHDLTYNNSFHRNGRWLPRDPSGPVARGAFSLSRMAVSVNGLSACDHGGQGSLGWWIRGAPFNMAQRAGMTIAQWAQAHGYIVPSPAALHAHIAMNGGQVNPWNLAQAQQAQQAVGAPPAGRSYFAAFVANHSPVQAKLNDKYTRAKRLLVPGRARGRLTSLPHVGHPPPSL